MAARPVATGTEAPAGTREGVVRLYRWRRWSLAWFYSW